MSAGEAARRKGIPVIGEVELAAYFLQGSVCRHHRLEWQDDDDCADRPSSESVGIACQVGGNIGTPPTAMVDTSPRANGTCWSYRVSNSRQSMSSSAHIAVCTNVTPDHLDRHHTFEIMPLRRRGCLRRKQPTATPS